MSPEDHGQIPNQADDDPFAAERLTPQEVERNIAERDRADAITELQAAQARGFEEIGSDDTPETRELRAKVAELSRIALDAEAALYDPIRPEDLPNAEEDSQ